MKVVFDTNVFVSALLLPGGAADRALRRIVAGEHVLALSKPIVLEVLEVLARKFGREPEELARVAVLLADLGEVVHPPRRIRVLDDDSDNRVLECAVAAGADAIVTGDRTMLRLGRIEAVRIVTLRAYLAL